MTQLESQRMFEALGRISRWAAIEADAEKLVYGESMVQARLKELADTIASEAGVYGAYATGQIYFRRGRHVARP